MSVQKNSQKRQGFPTKWNDHIQKLCRILFFLFIIWLVFHKHYKEIYAHIRDMSIQNLLLISLMGISFQWLGGAAFYLLTKKRNPQFSLRQSIECSYLGFFGNIIAFSFGSIPLRTYFLHLHGIDVGEAIGWINMDYILHKSSVLLCNLALYFFFGRQIWMTQPELRSYVLLGYGICLLIIGGLVLIGFSEQVYLLVCRLLCKIPEKGKWKTRKEKVQYHLEMMHCCAKNLKGEGLTVIQSLLLHCIKLIIMYAIPFFCLSPMENMVFSFEQVLFLTAVTNLISSALPNVSGMGSTELAFLIVFSAYINEASVSSILVLYRFATYFLPFLISLLVWRQIEKGRKQRKE